MTLNIFCNLILYHSGSLIGYSKLLIYLLRAYFLQQPALASIATDLQANIRYESMYK